MIRIGLTGFTDHPLLASTTTKASAKLFDYSGHFPIVEIDSSFYAIPKIETVRKWLAETPTNFRFIVKAHQAMTGHQRREDWTFTSIEEIYQTFETCLMPMYEANKLYAVLVQFPPWYDAVPKNIAYIRKMNERLTHFQLAVEFRNQTWFDSQHREATLNFLRQEKIINVICDEPQAGAGSIPFVAEATTNQVMFRFHGRNLHGWRNVGNAENWRKVRFLYNYSDDELAEFVKVIKYFDQQHKDIVVTFNNNSAHDAAPNAKRLQQLLNVSYEGLAPRQLDIFREGW